MLLYNTGSSCSSLSPYFSIKDLHVQSIGIIYLNMGFHVKTLTGDFPILFGYMRVFQL